MVEIVEKATKVVDIVGINFKPIVCADVLYTIQSTCLWCTMYDLPACILHSATMYWTVSEASLQCLHLGSCLVCLAPFPMLFLATDLNCQYQALFQPVGGTYLAEALPLHDGSFFSCIPF